MNETEFGNHFRSALKDKFSGGIYLQKNHGGFGYQQAGRPDIEGSLYGRHIVFELKAGSYFSGIQKTQLEQYGKVGSISGGIILHDNKVYWARWDTISTFSYRNPGVLIGTATKKGIDVDFTFLWNECWFAYCFFLGTDPINIFLDKWERDAT